MASGDTRLADAEALEGCPVMLEFSKQ